jgi:hypothetical protein
MQTALSSSFFLSVGVVGGVVGGGNLLMQQQQQLCCWMPGVLPTVLLYCAGRWVQELSLLPWPPCQILWF